jgi:DNA-binding transcriptional LysR family regulator
MTSLPPDMLRSFIAIADSGSFSRAAGQVNRTQSAVSMQIKKLEELIGKALLIREGKSSQLTHEGELLLSYARRIIQLNDESLSLLQRPELTGSVRIGLPDDYATRFLPEILANFARAYPQVQVEVTCLPSSSLLPLLETGKLELALSTSPEPQVDGARLLRREPTVWVTSAQHLAHEIRPLPLALFESDCYCRRWATSALEQAGIPYRIAYTSPSIMGLIAATSAGLAITMMSRSILPPGLRPLTTGEGFAPLPDASILLHRHPQANTPITDCLAEHIALAFKEERS